MKKLTSLIVVLFAVTGTFAQKPEYASEKKYTKHVITELQKENAKSKITPTLIVTAQNNTAQYSLEEYETMVKRCKELTGLLLKYEESYRDGSMSKRDKKKWKKDLMEAKLLNLRIEDFNSHYRKKETPIVEYLNIQVLNNFEDFSKTLETSKQYAGF